MTDILVIGGGIAGLSAAARLSHLGEVRLLERETALGYHTSGRSAALFEECYGKPAVVALNRASHRYLAEANGGVLSPRGLLMIAGDDLKTEFDADVAAMELHLIDKDRALALWPDLNPASFTVAAYGAHAWDIDTDRLMQNFAREVKANGGTISTKAEVRAIRKTRSDWEVELTTDETITAQILVNAAGSWADKIAEMAGIPKIGFTPYRRSMGRIPAPGGADVSTWPMIFGAGETWYAKPDAGALIVSPAEEFAMEPHDAFADDMTLAEGIARYEEHMQTPVTRLLSSWAGLRTFAPDRQLVLGPDARDPSFVWSAGQGGYGFQTSPAASQLVADLVAGRQPELDGKTVTALSPARFA
jgi:D-arginine dehydrogenase